MSKQKATRAKATRGVRNLPAKKASAKQFQDVKGGSFSAGFKAGVTTGAKSPLKYMEVKLNDVIITGVPQRP